MKKIVIGAATLLLLLAGCGQKKETTSSSKHESETLQSTLPVLENAEKNTVVTKTLIFPESGDGVKQTQTITYKGKQFSKIGYSADTALK